MKQLLIGLCCATLTALAQPAAAFDLQGHRGARGLAPENTLPAFAAAMALGVDALELDVASTRDGVLVVSHDGALNPDFTRGPDGVWLAARGPLIRSLSLAELKRYDVGRLRPGSRYAAAFPDQQPVDGTTIPTLAEVFALVKAQGHPGLRLAIETKLSPLAPDDALAPEPLARAVIAAIRDAGLTARCSVLSFDWRTLQVVQREAPEIPTVYLTAQQRGFDNVGAGSAEPSPWTAGWRYADHGSVPRLIHAAGGRIWSALYTDLDTAKLAEAHALGLTVLAWTVNDPVQIARLLDLGVDGLVSDRPDRVRSELARRGLPLPPAFALPAPPAPPAR
jgi:glycerophosphoryl diester phosphodiesterase